MGTVTGAVSVAGRREPASCRWPAAIIMPTSLLLYLDKHIECWARSWTSYGHGGRAEPNACTAGRKRAGGGALGKNAQTRRRGDNAPLFCARCAFHCLRAGRAAAAGTALPCYRALRHLFVPDIRAASDNANVAHIGACSRLSCGGTGGAQALLLSLFLRHHFASYMHTLTERTGGSQAGHARELARADMLLTARLRYLLGVTLPI